MKNFGRNSILSFGSLLLAAAWLFTSAAQAATPGAAQVKKVVGTAAYTDAKGGGPLKEGDILFQGATITTGAGSYVDLFLGVNGDSLRVEADSTLALNKLDYTKAGETIVNTQLEVTKGAVVANVINKLSKASKYEIKTPAGVAGIRGTVLRVTTSRVICLIGRVEFRSVNGQLQLVIGGTVYAAGATGSVKATVVETTGLASTACSLTANTVANMVAATVQQFTAVLAAEAATEAGKAGGNSAAVAAQAAKAIMAELVQAVLAAAADAPPAIRAAAQAAAANLVATSETVQTKAAASAAVVAMVANGGNAQQAQQAAQQAANQSTSNPTLANSAANGVTPQIAAAIQIRNQGGSQVEIIAGAGNPPPPPPGPVPPPQGTVTTKVGETVIFVSPTQ